jgi:hypothetical protein
MGSMPEGRKCLDCIGRPVAESRRDALGRGSRVLRRLLSAAEVELVMRSERECAANQLRADDVYVNGSRLSPEELVVLQGCPCPPSRLRPGFYWYDKVSGFWGKVCDLWGSGFSFAYWKHLPAVCDAIDTLTELVVIRVNFVSLDSRIGTLRLQCAYMRCKLLLF